MRIFNSYVAHVISLKLTIIEIARFKPLDIAAFFYESDVNLSKQKEIVESLWLYKDEMINSFYTFSKFFFIDEINQEIYKLAYDNKNNSLEFINKVLKELDSDYYITQDNYVSSYVYFALKQKKLKLLFISKRGYISMKLRSLIKEMGYMRRTKDFVREIEFAVKELNLTISKNGDKDTRLESLKLDDRVTIRLNPHNCNDEMKSIDEIRSVVTKKLEVKRNDPEKSTTKKNLFRKSKSGTNRTFSIGGKSISINVTKSIRRRGFMNKVVDGKKYRIDVRTGDVILVE